MPYLEYKTVVIWEFSDITLVDAFYAKTVKRLVNDATIPQGSNVVCKVKKQIN